MNSSFQRASRPPSFFISRRCCLSRMQRIFSSKSWNKRQQCHDWSKTSFDQPVKNDLRTYENISKNSTGQKDDYTSDWQVDCFYFKRRDKLIVVGLSGQQALNANPKAMKWINFTVNLEQAENTTMFFILKKVKETILDFSQITARVL